LIRTRALLRRFERFFPFVADHYLIVSFLFIILIVGDGLRRGDAKIREELNLTVYRASAQIGHLIGSYAASDAYGDREILLLVKTEVKQTAEALTNPSQIALQVISVRRNTLLDSGSEELLPNASIPNAAKPLWNLLSPDIPVRFAEYDVTKDWRFRTTITRGAYLDNMLAHLLKTTLWVGLFAFVLGLFPHFYRESVLARRHFEALLQVVLTDPSTLKNPDDLIVHLPQFIRKVLGFDTVAVYWRSGDQIPLRAIDSAHEWDRDALQKSINATTITVENHLHEAQVALVNQPIVARRRGWRRALYIAEGSDAEKVYVIAPVWDSSARLVAGVITAERAGVAEPGDKDALLSIARMVMLLVRTARENATTEQNNDQLVSLAQQVALGTIITVVAHNLKTPLSMIGMAARNLGEKWTDMDQRRIDERLIQIETLSAQCLAVLTTITSYNRIGDGASTSDLHDVLEKSCALFEHYLRLRRVLLVKNFQPDYRPRVRLRAVDLQQVVTNLIINADQAFADRVRTSSMDTIEVSTKATDGRDGVVIRVRDNGPGISSRDREHIFTENFTTKPYGTGAGLPYCRRVIVRAGGSIELETTSSVGASFNIFLPTMEEVQ
jgi:signal transduction histidine kinase